MRRAEFGSTQCALLLSKRLWLIEACALQGPANTLLGSIPSAPGKTDGNRGSSGVDVLRPSIFHDRPVAGSRWRLPGRAQSPGLAALVSFANHECAALEPFFLFRILYPGRTVHKT